MSRLCVYSEAPAGGDRYWLDNLGLISGLRYSKTYPGGPATASWQMVLDPRAHHRAWNPGRSIGIVCGGSTVWRGELDNPTRGTVWQFNAIGAAADAKRFLSVAADANAYNLNEVVDAAITRGMPWTRSSSLPSLPASGTAPSGSVYLDEAMQTVLEGQSTATYWRLDRNNILLSEQAPTTATHILLATDPGGGRTLEQFVTDVVVGYINSATGQPSTVTISATSRPFGRFEAPLDLTSQGFMTTSAATSAGQRYLAVNGARAKFTDAFTVAAGQLLTIGGRPVDLATFRPGHLFTVILTDPDSAGEVALAAPITCIGGLTDYDVDSDVLTLGTTDYSSDSLPSALFSSAA